MDRRTRVVIVERESCGIGWLLLGTSVGEDVEVGMYLGDGGAAGHDGRSRRGDMMRVWRKSAMG